MKRIVASGCKDTDFVAEKTGFSGNYRPDFFPEYPQKGKNRGSGPLFFLSEQKIQAFYFGI
ncbi:MAG TPA: hypothetical protein H9752_05925 [Candidatus Phocaeicola excrementigallinarum]|nr:hypothetical protein [Candidatus Phocaeicola excrementigallinarum]